MERPRKQRDLAVADVVAKMIKEGHYPEEFHYFGYAYWEDNQIKFFIASNEKLVYNTWELGFAEKIAVTPVLNFLRRTKVAEEERDEVMLRLQNELRQKLMDTFPIEYFKLLVPFALENSKHTAYSILEQYRLLIQQETPEKWRVFAGLVKMAKVAKTLDDVDCIGLLEGIVPQASIDVYQQEISGFAYLDNDGR